jgi:Uri superfamily endonuclease
MHKGVYCLVFRNTGCRMRIGALGEREFTRGWHCYVGSARGSGGLEKRVGRHAALRERGGPRHWHVDHILLHPAFSLERAVCAATEHDCECALAARIPGSGVPGFGCSDCGCGSHLVHSPTDPTRMVVEVFSALSLAPCITTLKRGDDQ